MPNPAEDDFGPWTKTTPSDGRVVFSQLVAEDDYEITISHPDYESTEAQLYLSSDGDEVTYQIEEIPESSKYRLTIQVSDSGGVAISGVEVTTNSLTKTTDTNGEVWFDLTPDTWTVHFSHPDYQDTSKSIATGESATTEQVTLQSASGSGSGPVGGIICRTTATIATGESITLTVGEDLNSTGTVDNTVTIDVPDGTTEHSVDGLAGPSATSATSTEVAYNEGGYGEGEYTIEATFGEAGYGEGDYGGESDDNDNSYAISADLSADSDEGTPQLHSVEIESDAADPVASMFGRVGGGLIEIPLYDTTDVGDARFQANPPNVSGIVAVGLIDRSESALQCRTPDGAIHGVYTEPVQTTQGTSQ